MPAGISCGLYLQIKEIFKMAKKGDWVRIHKVVLPAAERTAKIPADTKQVDFEMWVKGTLQN